VESGSIAAPPAPGAGLGSEPGDKGLKTGALGFVSNVVIGVASTAPGYSLAASLGLVVGVAGIGLQSPAILLAAGGMTWPHRSWATTEPTARAPRSTPRWRSRRS
jgi:hypothetical protein